MAPQLAQYLQCRAISPLVACPPRALVSASAPCKWMSHREPRSSQGLRFAPRATHHAGLYPDVAKRTKEYLVFCLPMNCTSIPAVASTTHRICQLTDAASQWRRPSLAQGVEPAQSMSADKHSMSSSCDVDDRRYSSWRRHKQCRWRLLVRSPPQQGSWSC